jgi:hypothetical protein
VDAGGNIIVADCGNHKIRRILSDGTVQTIAGTQQGTPSGDGIGMQVVIYFSSLFA